jgi:hypothetical protein
VGHCALVSLPEPDNLVSQRLLQRLQVGPGLDSEEAGAALFLVLGSQLKKLLVDIDLFGVGRWLRPHERLGGKARTRVSGSSGDTKVEESTSGKRVHGRFSFSVVWFWLHSTRSTEHGGRKTEGGQSRRALFSACHTPPDAAAVQRWLCQPWAFPEIHSGLAHSQNPKPNLFSTVSAFKLLEVIR